MRIACPKCEWEPKADDRWCCSPGCGHVWNTFDTMARCPICGKQWKETCCFVCETWSPHLDWYHDIPQLYEDEDELVEVEMPAK